MRILFASTRFSADLAPRWCPLKKEDMPAFLASAGLKGVDMPSDVLERLAKTPVGEPRTPIPLVSPSEDKSQSEPASGPNKPLGRELAVRIFGTPFLKCDRSSQ